jgi:tRNA1(Val) A37 N6-methylase TrmN6
MKSDLFNRKTINRFISNIEPTSKQKAASKRWISLIENNHLENEKSAYIEFANTLLRDILNYNINIEELKHEENYMEFLFKDVSKNNLVVFEAKGTKTKDLWASQGRNIKIKETPVNQVNYYLMHNKIPYGVLTNYREFVLFKREEGDSKFHQLNFLDIKSDPDKLKEFIAIFSKESFEKDETNRLYVDSIVEERNFTKEFYKLYHETRLMILKEFKESGIDNKLSLHYSQLFLNRLMFILFAEDRDLLDKKYFETKILEVLDNGGGIDNHTDYIFGKIKGIFKELDKEIPKQIKGFNGELFKEEIDGRLSFKDYRTKSFFKDVSQNHALDKKLELNDDEKQIFNKHKDKLNPIIENILLMASFDFNTEVNVNILGHVFEQSISDIENLKEETMSKRKKEGIFYTPEYITEYICRNTIIPYLSKSGTNDINELVDEHSEDIEELEIKFKSIKILDPACGSGAFLIKSTEILFEIFEKIQWVKENQGSYQAHRGLKKGSNFKGQATLKKWDEKEEIKNIIENNIFGVDINEESVEITKLSLFLKIAGKNKKLINLSRNILCGNSLIDNNNYERAFNWKKEFNNILSYDNNGNLNDGSGFDIVIGNPPYVRQERFTDIKQELEKQYTIYSGVADLYTYFYEKGISVLKKNGYLGYISSNKWMKVKYGLGLRQLLKQKKLLHLIDFFELKVFEDASTEPIIVILQNSKEQNKNLSVAPIKTLKFGEFNDYIETITFQINQSDLEDEGWNFSKKGDKSILEIMRKGCVSLKEFTEDNLLYGVKTGLNEVFVIDEKIKDELIYKSASSKEVIHPIIDGVDIEPYTYNFSERYLIFIPRGNDINNYPAVRDYLKQFYNQIRPKNSGEKTGRKPGKYKWYESQDNVAYWRKFLEPKIIFIHTAKNHYFACDTKGYFILNNCYFISSSSRYLLAFLNSKLFEFYKRNTFVAFGDADSKGRCKLDYNKMIKVPIKKINSEKEEKFNILVNKNIEIREKFNLLRLKCIRRIKTEFNIEAVPKKLDSFYNLKFDEFYRIIEKYKIDLSLKQKDEWDDYFNNYKRELLKLKDRIDQIDKETNNLIYDVYEIRFEKDRRIIEESLK